MRVLHTWTGDFGRGSTIGPEACQISSDYRTGDRVRWGIVMQRKTGCMTVVRDVTFESWFSANHSCRRWNVVISSQQRLCDEPASRLASWATRSIKTFDLLFCPSIVPLNTRLGKMSNVTDGMKQEYDRVCFPI